MNESRTEMERLLAEQMPLAPGGLRSNVESVVQESLRRKTMIDDIKFVGTCFVVLCLVVGIQWATLNSTDQQLKNISETSIASTSEAKRAIAALSKMNSHSGVIE